LLNARHSGTRVTGVSTLLLEFVRGLERGCFEFARRSLEA